MINKIVCIKLLIIFFAIIYLFQLNKAEAKKMTIKECLLEANEINATMSNMAIDEATTLINSNCLPPAHFIYRYSLDMNYKPFQGINIQQDLIPILKQQNINRYCTDPELNGFINRLDSVKYQYEDEKGNFLGSYTLNKNYCN